MAFSNSLRQRLPSFTVKERGVCVSPIEAFPAKPLSWAVCVEVPEENSISMTAWLKTRDGAVKRMPSKVEILVNTSSTGNDAL